MLLILLVLAGLACTSPITDRSKIPLLKWGGKLIPPLGLLFFIAIPFDIFTVFIWLAAGIIMLMSIKNLLRSTFIFFSQWRLKGPLNTRLFIESATRPTLSIVCFFVALSLVQMSTYSANAKALELAIATKDHVESTGSCSTERPVWATETGPYTYRNDSYSMWYGKYGTNYRITYSCSPEYQEYSYSVRINHDSVFNISGQFNGELEAAYGEVGNLTRVAIDDKIDLSALVKMKVVRIEK